MQVTVYFGYALFLLFILGFVADFLFFDTYDIPEMIRAGLLTSMFAFVFATCIPPLLGYIAGDKATKSRSKLVHHYNGVLFGVLAFWLATIFTTPVVFIDMSGWFGQLPQLITSGVFPAGLAVLTMLILALFFGRRTQHRMSAAQYRPYQIVFLSALGYLFILSGANIAMGTLYGANFVSSVAVLLLPVVMIAGLVAFGAWLIGPANGTVGVRVVKSLIALSYAVLAIAAVTALFWFSAALASVGTISAIIVWVAYIYLLRRYASQ